MRDPQFSDQKQKMIDRISAVIVLSFGLLIILVVLGFLLVVRKERNPRFRARKYDKRWEQRVKPYPVGQVRAA